LPKTPIVLSIIFLLLSLPDGLRAQQPPSSPPLQETLDIEQIQRQLEQIEEATDLEEAPRKTLLENYRQSLEDLQEADRYAELLEKNQTAVRTAASQLEQVQAELSRVRAAQPAAPPDHATAMELQEDLAEKEITAKLRLQEMTELEAEPQRRAERRKEILKLIDQARENLEQVDARLNAPEVEGGLPAVNLSKRLADRARKKRLVKQIASLEAEWAAIEATGNLLSSQIELAKVKHRLSEAEVKAWQSQLQKQRKIEAQKHVEQARLDVFRTHPKLQPLAEENHELAEEETELIGKMTTVNRDVEIAEEKLLETQQEFKNTQDRVDNIGLTNAIGILLRSRRAKLPSKDDYLRRIRMRQSEIRRSQMRWFELQDELSAMGSVEEATGHFLQRNAAPQDMQPQKWQEAVASLMKSRRTALEKLVRNYDLFISNSVKLDDTEQKLVQVIEEYKGFIDELVFWIASAEPFSLKHAVYFQETIHWLGSVEAWAKLGGSLVGDARQRPALWGLALLLFGLFLAGRSYLNQKILDFGEQARQGGARYFYPTVLATLLTLLIVSTWPGVLWFLGWRFAEGVRVTDFGEAVGRGLVCLANFLWPLELFRLLSQPKGVAEAHFNWPSGSLRPLGKMLTFLLIAGSPLIFLYCTVEYSGNERLNNSFGRAAFIIFLGVVAVSVHLLLRPSGNFFRHLATKESVKWFYRLRQGVYVAGLSAPIILAGIAIAGYYYTARQLGERLCLTVYLMASLATVGAFLARWILIARRQLMLQRIRQKRSEQQSVEPSVHSEASLIAGIASQEEEEVDPGKLSVQTFRFVNTLLLLVGMMLIWVVWDEVFPALGIFDQIPVFTYESTITETSTSAEGVVTTKTSQVPRILSIADIGLVLLILVVTFMAAKNISGFLGFAIPQKLPLNPGTRYAISTITQYVIVIIGIGFSCSFLGLTWSKVQWLVAAVSVGLGFGLQEIFANFVSGLILLFEQPVRVGDVITLGDVTGVVSRIQIRATTVRGWDRKELIVPNKEFVTGNLLNWTRSDHVNRIVVTVGITYGSDTEKAKELLLKIAREHPKVAREPEPFVMFEGFADSSLTIVLRCFTARMEDRWDAIHELHTEIHRQFNEKGLQFAFPHMDLLIRNPQDLFSK
jgi:potassium efflux system protein